MRRQAALERAQQASVAVPPPAVPRNSAGLRQARRAPDGHRRPPAPEAGNSAPRRPRGPGRPRSPRHPRSGPGRLRARARQADAKARPPSRGTPRLSSITSSSNTSALTASTRSAARFHSSVRRSRMRSGKSSSSHSGSIALASRTSGSPRSLRSSTSIATRNSAVRTTLSRASTAEPPLGERQFVSAAPARHAVAECCQ